MPGSSGAGVPGRGFAGGPGAGKKEGWRLDVVFNNLPGRSDFRTGWGNATLIRGRRTRLLFDTGCDGGILLHNLKKLGVSPAEIQVVVLSHNHWDHVDGLWALLGAGGKPRVFVPARFPEAFKKKVRAAGGRIMNVKGPRKIGEAVYSGGQLRGRKWEQALVVKSSRGPVILTGCAHPGIARVAERCSKLFGEPYLLAGGFHLKDSSSPEIKSVAARLRGLGVLKMAPNHCTGAAALRGLAAAWGPDFIKAGCGQAIKIP